MDQQLLSASLILDLRSGCHGKGLGSNLGVSRTGGNTGSALYHGLSLQTPLICSGFPCIFMIPTVS